MNRDEKKQEVERLQRDLAAAQNVFLMNFQKVPVAEDFELRKQVRAAGGRYRVVKNTLIRRGGKGTPAEPILGSLEGPTAMALTDDNPVALAKA
ncbi:MAG: 50S ribosomal protein L10, partial [Acidobacteria bacterium]|nr:50S ribosomal protein L10 [Acidobacteriota bacterium]